jgi:hypothetical protein
MSNDVQTHEEAAERVAGEERRASIRHAARSLGSVTARIIGGSQVDLVNFSSRGVLFECDSRLLIGARASVRITTPDANLIVTGRVVRSRVKGLVNGALRYDAALVLDTELGLVPAIADAPLSNPEADFDDLVAFESDFEASGAPSPVEAYLAESEASLLEVANGTEHAAPPVLELDAPVAAIAAPEAVVEDVAPIVDEPPPVPAVATLAVEDAVPETVVSDEPIAFEADADVAFEPAEAFAFDDVDASFAAAETVVAEVVDAPVEAAIIEASVTIEVTPIGELPEEDPGTSMFDATYIPPSDDAPVSVESQFEVTPPRPVASSTTSSFFDARPSESYGEAAEVPIEAHAEVQAEAHVDFEGEVAFEAEDAVMFETAFEDTPAVEETPVVEAAVEAVAEIEPEPLVAAEPNPVLDEAVDLPAAVPDADDRVLLQFAATVPHDLADLRRIAADNQW